ncbi:histidine kinase dimerization/phosphoacceptor domain -containing protein [Roseivivax sediminis]|uniref:Two-component sensor histidine kinase, contains HisKA and HATPase domains n=1 Tax=Roseivivax sediminis TaxID=936889 RepID=A0A1I1XMA9_9RHOB|nr:histidine kinase dimerization/phosphoacceptor domain -containing protein [Roseivivax sediminis]SFE08539.1 Two-component sensor histidine kinase, contains HisKA and HATPase domains [Roseivivax sediminis]
MRAPIPDNQAERLEELESYGILDTPPEDSFDEVVALVKQLCDVPVALISLVDSDRQWFKAREGFALPETPIEMSICAHTILDEGVLEIPDTQADPRTEDNPLCTAGDAPIRFYAGAPLISASGYALGSLWVLDTRPRKLTDVQREALQTMARQVMRQLDLRRALRNEAILRNEIDHRVKNSLQTVASFIRLYTSRAQSEETRDALAAISRRVNAISQLHNELYRTSEFDMIRLDTYLGRVTDLLRGSFARNVSLKTSFAPVRVDSRRAATLAMIVSEFAANANKHAFPDNRDGVVSISLEKDEDEAIHLTCADNGIGDQAAHLPTADSEITSIGMRLMESAAEQIGGQLSLDASPQGYRLTLVTPPHAAEAGPREVLFSAE